MIDKTCGHEDGYENSNYDSAAGGSAYKGLWPWMSSLGYYNVRRYIDISV